MEIHLVIALNMMDMTEEKRLKVDTVSLAERLGCPVVPIVASKGKGVEELKRLVASGTVAPPTAEIEYPASVRDIVDDYQIMNGGRRMKRSRQSNIFYLVLAGLWESAAAIYSGSGQGQANLHGLAWVCLPGWRWNHHVLATSLTHRVRGWIFSFMRPIEAASVTTRIEPIL